MVGGSHHAARSNFESYRPFSNIPSERERKLFPSSSRSWPA